MANIGRERREIEIVPIPAPAEEPVPVSTPAEEPAAPTPEREPVPA